MKAPDMNNLSEDFLKRLRERAEAVLANASHNDRQVNARDISELVHDLSVYQVELELQNEELRHSNQLLENTRDSFAQLYNQAPVGYLTVSSQGIILQCNQTFCDFTQGKCDQVIGKPLADLLTEADRKVFLSRYKAIYRNPHGKSMDVCFQRSDGSSFYAQLTSREAIQTVMPPTKGSADGNLLVIVTDITSRKKIEDALVQSMARLDQAQEVAHIGNWELDVQTNRLWGSEEAFRIYGIERDDPYLDLEQVRGIPLTEDRQKMDEALQDLIQNDSNYDLEYRIMKEGEDQPRVIHSVAKILRDSNGSALRVVGVLQDITERKLAEEALRRSELYFRALFEQTAVGVAVTDAQTGEFLKVNQRLSEILGYSPHELNGVTFKTITHPDDVSISIEAMNRLLSGEIFNFVLEKRYLRKDGSTVWTTLTVSAMWDPGQLPTSYVVIVQDITDRKNYEQKLQENLHFLKTLIDTIPNPIFFKDLQGNFTGCNTMFAEQILGLPKEKIIGRALTGLGNVIPADLAEYHHNQDIHLLKNPGIQVFDAEIVCADGAYRDFTLYKSTYSDVQNQTSGLVGIMMDITSRKKMEDDLRRSEKRYRSVVQTATDAIIMANSAGEIVAWNNGAKAIFQYSEDEILGKSLTRLMPNQMIEPHIASMNYVVGGGEPRYIGRAVEVMALRKDQTEFPIELVLSTWEEDNELFFTGIIRDITERKLFEEKLQFQNTHDILTGLFNRQYYETEIQRLQNGRRFPISIIVMDMDGLKKINDSLGHSVGDEHLRQLAGLLKQCFRPEDLIARIGGDEFVAVLPETNFTSAANVIKRLRNHLQEINEKKNDLYIVDLSIGLATCENQTERLSYVFKQADRAMYEEKNNKKR